MVPALKQLTVQESFCFFVFCFLFFCFTKSGTFVCLEPWEVAGLSWVFWFEVHNDVIR